jgi:hypothetical protein
VSDVVLRQNDEQPGVMEKPNYEQLGFMEKPNYQQLRFMEKQCIPVNAPPIGTSLPPDYKRRLSNVSLEWVICTISNKQ